MLGKDMDHFFNCSDEHAAHEVDYSGGWSGTFIAVFTAISNLCVIVSVVQKLRREVSVLAVLVLGLAVHDFGAGALSFPLVAAAYFRGMCWTGGWHACAYNAFMHVFLLTSSQFTVVLIAADRFAALMAPFCYQNWAKPRITICALMGITVFSAFFAVLPLLGVVDVVPIFGVVCSFDWADSTTSGRFYIYWSVVQGFGLIALLLVMNGFVLVEVRRMNSRIERVPQGDDEREERRLKKQERYSEFTVLVIMVSIVFVVCTAPILSMERQLLRLKKQERYSEFTVLVIMVSIVFAVCTAQNLVRTVCNQLQVLPSEYADYVAKRFNIISSMINPHLYWTFRPKARKAFSNFFREKFACRKRSDDGNGEDNSTVGDSRKDPSEASWVANSVTSPKNNRAEMIALREILADPNKLKEIADELANPTKVNRHLGHQNKMAANTLEVEYRRPYDDGMEHGRQGRKQTLIRVSEVDLRFV